MDHIKIAPQKNINSTRIYKNPPTLFASIEPNSFYRDFFFWGGGGGGDLYSLRNFRGHFNFIHKKSLTLILTIHTPTRSLM
jgi:hypothetical protein